MVLFFHLDLLFCEAFPPSMTTITAKHHNNLKVVPDFQMTASQNVKPRQDTKNDKYLIILL